MVFVEHLAGRPSARVCAQLGAHSPLHATGVGLVLPAHAATEFRATYLTGELGAFSARGASGHGEGGDDHRPPGQPTAKAGARPCPALRGRLTAAANQLKAVLLAVDPALRESLDGLTNTALVSACAQLPGDQSQAVFTMRLLARRIQCLSEELKELTRRTTKAVRASWPILLDLVGVGPDSAAAVLIAAGDNPSGSPARRPSPPCAGSARLSSPPAGPSGGA